MFLQYVFLSFRIFYKFFAIIKDIKPQKSIFMTQISLFVR